MTRIHRALMAGALLLVVACGGGQPTTAPTAQPTSASTATPGATLTAATPTDAATPTAEITASVAPNATSGASLDPSQSDAGIAARVTIVNDTRLGGRDGTHDIYAVADDGSECSGSFDEPDFVVVAWYDDAPDGMIHRFGIGVGADDIPTADGTTADVTDGGVSFDFVSPTGFGTTYSGNSTVENEGTSTIDITRSGSTLTFDFEGVTYDNANFAGQFVCTDA